MAILPGDVFLTRNIPEFNDSPGYWQHAAISNGWAIVEGQMEPGLVIMVTEKGFLGRNPERLHLRPKDEEVGKLAAKYLDDYVGAKYDRRFFNCITLIRKVYGKALGYDPHWIMPDGLYRSTLFTHLEHYKNYENWVKPEDWYSGRIV